MTRIDVFLSHASADKPAVQYLAHKLREAGLEPFLDKWHLIPGDPWQEALEKALDQSHAVVVFVGKELGPWQNEEMRSAIETRVRDGSPRVIPVLLPGSKEKLPRFLRRLSWVDFRSGLEDEEAFRYLVAGIRGEVPGPGGGGEEKRLWSIAEIPGGIKAGVVEEVDTSFAPGIPDRVAEKAYNELVAQEVLRIRLKMSVALAEAREDSRVLAERVQSTDLKSAGYSAKALVYQLAARLHAGSAETLDAAKRLRRQLLQVDPTAGTRVIDALLLEAEGDVDGALRMLRDVQEPDVRGVFFAMLARHRGNTLALEWLDSQTSPDNADFFTGHGWFNLAVVLAQCERWEEACEYLAQASKHCDSYPDLLYIEGIINAALTLRADLRHLVLSTNLPSRHVLEGPEVDKHRERALDSFRRAQDILSPISPGRAAVAGEWMLWLRLTNPADEERDATTMTVARRLQVPEQGISLVPLAEFFDIPFDADRYWRYLDLRDQLGGLNNEELHARFVLARIRLSPREAYEFLEQEESRLGRIIPRSYLMSEKIRVLMLDDQVAAARQLLEEHRSDFDEDEYQIISLNLDTQEGKDPRVQLAERYAKTRSLLDLENLAKYLAGVGDWKALRPLQEELFRVEPNRANLSRLIACIERENESSYDKILALLESNLDLVNRDPDLIAAKAQAMLRLGRVEEARVLSDRLLRERNNATDIDFDIDLALQAGEWERFPVIVEREWPKRKEFEADLLMRLAALASETDSTADRAVELLRLAAQKGSNDPHILMMAIGLMYQLGREGKEVTEWLSRALVLSSEDGPVRHVELRKVVEEIMPKHREESNKVLDLWLRGKIPVHFASEHLNIPLSILLMELPRNNSKFRDSRRFSLIPITSGARQPVEVQPEWRIGFDISSLMVLHQLGVLKEALARCHQAMIAPDTMLVLLNEKKSIRFHQPSLVKAANEIRNLIDRGLFNVAQDLPIPPTGLAEEVGYDLAQLLEAAKNDGGCVIRPRPIYKLGTFLGEEAQIDGYEDLVLSTLQFMEVLKERGDLDVDMHERASLYLYSRDQGSENGMREPGLNGPVYVDDLALSYLREAGALRALEGTQLDLRIHPSLKEDQLALIANAHERDKLLESVGELRTILRDAMQQGQLGFLPRHNPTDKEERVYRNAPTLSQLMRDLGNCDAVCVDDRFLQRFGRLGDCSDRQVPMVCVLDILDYLKGQDILSQKQRHSKLHSLRQSGFACIPVEGEELVRHLPEQIKDGVLVESPELRVIRQTIARIRSLDIIEASEAAFLGRLQLASVMAIRQLWADESVSVEHASHLSGWIWRHVAPLPLDWIKAEPENQELLVIACIHHFGLLMTPQAISEERLAGFAEWVQADVLEPLLSVNAEIVDQLAVYVGQQIESWSKDIGKEDEGAASHSGS